MTAWMPASGPMRRAASGPASQPVPGWALPPPRTDAGVGVGLEEALRFIGRAATVALYRELELDPKPGLVSPVDSGSHADMDAMTFMRSLFALRVYFPAIVRAGARGEPFAVLQALGRQAESRMLAATGGVNTHRGAIFALGLLCAAAGRVAALGPRITESSLREALDGGWGAALRERARRAAAAPAVSKGQRAARAHGLSGAGEEAARLFPVLFSVTLPALRAARGAGVRASRVQALFATIGELDDTNLAHRGGIEGLRFAQQQARAFLAAGGVLRPGWREHAQAVHRAFVARRLSPGGAADLLACACWFEQVSHAGARP